MSSYRRLLANEPVWIFAVLWPFVFLAPILPGLPKAWLNSLPWRQELVIAFLLLLVLVLLLRGLITNSRLDWRVLPAERSVYWSLALFVFWSAVSITWSQGSLNAIHYTFTWTAYFCCFVLLKRVAAKPRLLRASLISLAIAISIVSLVSAIEFWSTSPDLYQYALILRRATGLGEPLAVSIPIFAVLALRLHNKRAALLFGMTVVLAWLATLQTLERAPLIALLTATVCMVIGLTVKKRWRPRRFSRVLLLVGALILTTTLQISLPRSGSSSSFQRVQQLDQNDATTQIRILVWAVGLEMVRQHPLRGVGAGNFEMAYPSARGSFSSAHPTSNLINQQEDLLAQRAHNEYVQIIAELGIAGFVLFILFCALLIRSAFRALRRSRNPLALGAFCSLITFAISSGASSVSFRWFGSGILFFFAAAIILRFSHRQHQQSANIVQPRLVWSTTVFATAFALVFLCGNVVLGISSTMRGLANHSDPNAMDGQGQQPSATERYFRSALWWNPADAPTHFDYGGWLYAKKRYREAVEHLRFATEHGFNSSTCYAFLAGAQAAAKDNRAAEETLARAVSVYPRSVFLRVRHSIALAESGLSEDAAHEYGLALAIEPSAARGWRQLMCFGADSAYAAAQADKNILPPMLLSPQSWAYPAIAEHATRPPQSYPADVTSSVSN